MINCKNCGKLVLEPNQTYGMNTASICQCNLPQKQDSDTPNKSNNVDDVEVRLDEILQNLVSGALNDDFYKKPGNDDSGLIKLENEAKSQILALINEARTEDAQLSNTKERGSV